MGTKNLYENGPNQFFLFGTKNLVRPTLMGTKNLYGSIFTSMLLVKVV